FASDCTTRQRTRQIRELQLHVPVWDSESVRRRPRQLGATTLFVMLAAAACAVDEAESLYLSAPRGEDAGMSRAEQIELVTRAIALAPDRPNYYETRAIYRIDRQEFP